MSDLEFANAAELTAVIFVVRQLIARLPQDEAEEIRKFVEDRAIKAGEGQHADHPVTKKVLRTVDLLFTAPTPETSSRLP